MGGDRFAFAIGIGSEINGCRPFGQLLQPIDYFFLPGNDNQLGLKAAARQIDTDLVLRQVLNMPEGSLNDEVFSEIFVDRFRLRWRFNDHK